MELDELTATRLIVALVCLGIALVWIAGRASDRRRRARFARLAAACGAQADHVSAFLSTFAIEVDGRRFAVSYRHIGGRHTPGWVTGWYLVTETVLRGVSELHAVEIRPRRRGRRRDRGADFAAAFDVRDLGMPLPHGWVTERVHASLAAFYDLDLPLELLSVEEGRLVHRAPVALGAIGAETVRELLSRQGSVAAALERAL